MVRHDQGSLCLRLPASPPPLASFPALPMCTQGCKSGRRSIAACEALAAAGYVDLTNVLGGWDQWAAQGLPSEQ